MITYKEAGVNIEEGYRSVKLIKEYASKRNGYMVSQAKSFFGLSDSEVKKYFGGVK